MALKIASAVVTQFAGAFQFSFQELRLDAKFAAPNLHERASGKLLLGAKQYGKPTNPSRPTTPTSTVVSTPRHAKSASVVDPGPPARGTFFLRFFSRSLRAALSPQHGSSNRHCPANPKKNGVTLKFW
jgi:hypothetical protein